MLDERIDQAEPTADVERESADWAGAYDDALDTLNTRVTLRVTEEDRRDIAAFMADHGIEGVTEALRTLIDLGLTSAALADADEWASAPSLRTAPLDPGPVQCQECGTTDTRLLRVVAPQESTRSYAVPYDCPDTMLQCAHCGQIAPVDAFQRRE